MSLRTLFLVLLSVLGVIATVAAQDSEVTSQPASQPAISQPVSPESAAALPNTVCPIMGGEAQADCFVEYEGKRVHFCCPGCIPTFNANPEEHLADLPQFSGEQEHPRE